MKAELEQLESSSVVIIVTPMIELSGDVRV
jgi:hypothetical protein